MSKNELALFVKNRRKLLKITQEELAEKAGVGLRFVRELENNKATLRIDKVNDVQTQSTNLQEAFQRGEDVPLTDVVLGMQKSSLAFEATLQVRNKVLKAYEEILNMPV